MRRPSCRAAASALAAVLLAAPLAAPSAPPAAPLAMPVRGVDPATLVDSFADGRGGRRHHAIDIMAPRGTPVVAATDGVVVRIARQLLGGNYVVQSDTEGARAYLYAHLDRFAKGLREGATVRQGDVLGYVGSTGNAPPNAPHLHFAVYAMKPGGRWWRGKPLNPFPLLAGGGSTRVASGK